MLGALPLPAELELVRFAAMVRTSHPTLAYRSGTCVCSLLENRLLAQQKDQQLKIGVGHVVEVISCISEADQRSVEHTIRSYPRRLQMPRE